MRWIKTMKLERRLLHIRWRLCFQILPNIQKVWTLVTDFEADIDIPRKPRMQIMIRVMSHGFKTSPYRWNCEISSFMYFDAITWQLPWKTAYGDDEIILIVLNIVAITSLLSFRKSWPRYNQSKSVYRKVKYIQGSPYAVDANVRELVRWVSCEVWTQPSIIQIFVWVAWSLEAEHIWSSDEQPVSSRTSRVRGHLLTCRLLTRIACTLEALLAVRLLDYADRNVTRYGEFPPRTKNFQMLPACCSRMSLTHWPCHLFNTDLWAISLDRRYLDQVISIYLLPRGITV